MAFVKLDCNIVDSTLWVEREGREVFITALLMAVPREFTEPIPQIEVDRLEYTGFIAPAGWYGFVPASGPGILHRARVEDGPGREALRMLGSPDPGSRSNDWEGRRMIRMDGGYLILNYIKYRDKDHTAAKRMQRYRERKRGTLSDGVTKLRDGVTLRNITQAEAEAEALKESTPNGVDGESKNSPCPILKIVELYHSVLPELPRVEKITKARAGYIKQRWSQDLQTLDQWKNYFTFVRSSRFLMGKANGTNGKPPFRADLEWITRPNNYAKIAEEKYHRE